MAADSHRILAGWRNHFSQLLNIHGVNDGRQTEIYTAEPLVPEPSAYEAKLAIENLQCHKSPGTDQIPAELIRSGAEQFATRSINLLLLFGIRRNCVRSGRSRSLYLSAIRAIKQNVVILPTTYVQNFIHHPDVKFNSICRGNYWGSSMWILTQQVSYCSYILHSSNT